MNPAFSISTGDGSGGTSGEATSAATASTQYETDSRSGDSSEAEASTRGNDTQSNDCEFDEGEDVIVSVSADLDVCMGINAPVDRVGLLERAGGQFTFYDDPGCQAVNPVNLAFAPKAPNWAEGELQCIDLHAVFTVDCELIEFAMARPGEPAFYAASTLLGDNGSPVQVGSGLDDPCECENDPPRQCCENAPGNYHLSFSTEIDVRDLGPGDTQTVDDNSGLRYEVFNGRSYITTECADSERFLYYVREV